MCDWDKQYFHSEWLTALHFKTPDNAVKYCIAELSLDFQQKYQAAERDYGGGDYKTAHYLASELLKQLEAEEGAGDDQLGDAALGWRAFEALLLGHIELHGLRRTDLAVNYYQLVLDCQLQDILADLARQGIQRSKNTGKRRSTPTLTSPQLQPIRWRIIHWIVAIDTARSLPHQHSPCINVWPKPIHGHAMAHESHLPSTSHGNTSP